MIELHQFDLARPIEQTLLIGTAAIDLTGTTVSLYIRKSPRGGPVRVRTSVTIKNQTTNKGGVSYQPVAEDVAEAGDYDLEWRVLYPGNLPLGIPTNGFETLRIHPSLAAAV